MVYSGYNSVSLGSSGVVGFTQGRPGGGWVHQWSFGSLKFALRVVRFNRGRWVH